MSQCCDDRLSAGLVWQPRVRPARARRIGPGTAAKLLIVAGDNPDRLRSDAALAALCGASPVEASSGKTRRHRLDRGGTPVGVHIGFDPWRFLAEGDRVRIEFSGVGPLSNTVVNETSP